jgi:hypothetical protein
MKTKKLFLAVGLLLLLPTFAIAGEVTDIIEITKAAFGKRAKTITLSNYEFDSGAEYTGKFDYDPSYPLAYMDNTYCLSTVASSPGTATSVTIWWDDSGDYNVEDESIIYVYGKHTAFTGSERLGKVSGGTLIGSQAYTGAEYNTIVLEDDYEYIAIVASADGIAFNELDITWETEDVSVYTIETSYTGGVSPYPTIDLDVESPVAAGTEVTVTFNAKAKNEIHSYTITGATVIEDTDLGEDGYARTHTTTFIMPAHSVEITAVFDVKPTREYNELAVDEMAYDFDTIIPSGEIFNLPISTEYYAGSDPAYTGGIKSITSSTGKVEILSCSYSAATGTGILSLRGLELGDDVIEITTYQTNDYDRDTREITITVVGREIALVTDFDGKYYAVVNTVGGAKADAYELLKDGDTYYYKSDIDRSQLIWQQEYTEDGSYITNSAGKYLKVAGANISLSSTSYEWYTNAYDRLVTGYMTGICYDEGVHAFDVNGQNDHSSSSTISACVYEISGTKLKAASEYTRSVTSGNYATMCLPYAVSRNEAFFSGVDVFNITGKYVSKGKVVGIEMEEETEALVAGKPYIIQATASTLSVWHGDETCFEEKGYATGLVGNLMSSTLYVPDGCYGIASNKLRMINGGTGKVGQYKAYLDLEDVPEVSDEASAPGRVRIFTDQPQDMENPDDNGNTGNTENPDEGSNVGTSLEDFLNNASLINWNEPVYNMLGQRVGKGATGVLIQNGQKYLVH